MKKIIFIISIFFTALNCISQERPSDLIKNLCEYKSDGSGKSLGLKIKFIYPCLWTELDGNRPHILRKFNYTFDDGSSIIQTITIKNINNKFNENEKMFTNSVMKEIARKMGEYISSRSVIIDGIEAGEVSFKTQQQAPVAYIYMYSLMYMFIYDNKLISVTFNTGSLIDSKAKVLFDEYQTLFKLLATKTIIFSKYK